MKHALAQYNIDREIGRGGFAITWLAWRGKKKVVLKELLLDKLEDWQALESFEREARVLSHLKHEGIPQFIEFIEKETDQGKHLFLVQEFIDGLDAQSYIQQGRYFTEAEVIHIAVQLTDVLNYLYQFSPRIVHRDIKPGNILLTDSQAYLVDFGAVKAPAQQTGLTMTGTVGYMPMEQIEGKATPASDIYALGMSLIYMLSHKEPQQMDKNNLRVDFQPHVNISKRLCKIIERMTDPDPAKRYDNPLNLKQDLERLQSGDTRSTGTMTLQTYWKPVVGIGVAMTLLGMCTLSELRAERKAAMAERKAAEAERLAASKPSSSPTQSLVAFYQRVGNQHYKKKAYTKAIENYDKFLEKQPNAFSERFRRGFSHGKLKQHDKALADFLYILKHDDTPDKNAYYNAGFHSFRLNKIEQAKGYFKQAVDVDPKNIASINYMGLIAMKQKQYDTALKWFNQGISIDPTYKFFHNNIGQVYQKTGQYDKALEAFETSLRYNQKKTTRINSQYARPYLHMAEIYTQQKKYDKVIEVSTQALVRVPRYVKVLELRANAYKALKNCEAAKADADKACELSGSENCAFSCPG